MASQDAKASCFLGGAGTIHNDSSLAKIMDVESDAVA